MTAFGAPFTHEAVFYDDLDGFLSDTVPFLREGIDADEAVLVAVDPVKADAMRAAALAEDPAAFVEQRDLFGEVADDERFRSAFLAARRSLRERGVHATVDSLLAG